MSQLSLDTLLPQVVAPWLIVAKAPGEPADKPIDYLSPEIEGKKVSKEEEKKKIYSKWNGPHLL